MQLESSAWSGTDLAGLGLPEPPATLVPDIRQVDERHWGTRPVGFALRGLQPYLREALAGSGPGQLLAGIEDISTNMPALHYFLSFGRLGLFVQGVLSFAEDGSYLTGPDLLALMAAAGRTQAAAVEAAAAGRLPGAGRLVVLQTPFEGWWRVTGPDGLEEASGCPGALAWLEGLKA
jgi:hypothetical protein